MATRNAAGAYMPNGPTIHLQLDVITDQDEPGGGAGGGTTVTITTGSVVSVSQTADDLDVTLPAVANSGAPVDP